MVSRMNARLTTVVIASLALVACDDGGVPFFFGGADAGFDVTPRVDAGVSDVGALDAAASDAVALDGGAEQGDAGDAERDASEAETDAQDSALPDLPPADRDGDGVLDESDLDPGDPLACADTDGDGCDDCSVHGALRPDDDGYDGDFDGTCEIAYDLTCLHGPSAADDPYRRVACDHLALANLDRVRFADESGNAAPLEWFEAAWEVARAHSQDMCDRNYFEHDNLEGQNAGERMRAAGLSLSGWAENIAIGAEPAVDAHYRFMAEPTCTGHRGNLLAPSLRSMAVGVILCENPTSNWRGLYYTTQNFRGGGGGSPSYCTNAATACELPPLPVSVAEAFCAFAGVRCQTNVSLAEWGCPDD